MAERKYIGQGVPFERTRRITGYLVGSLERFNNAKRSDEADRVKHGLGKDKPAVLCGIWQYVEED